MSTQRKIISIIIAVILIGIVSAVVYVLIPKATIQFSIAPDEFTVVINGDTHTMSTGQSLTVTPGSHIIEISRDEFDTYSTTVTVNNGETFEVLEVLTPQTDEARELLTTPASQEIIQRVAGREMKNTVDALNEAYPILSSLPLNDKFYKVTTCDSQEHPDDPLKVAICVYLYDPSAKDFAISAMSEKGYDLNEYETYYVDATYSAGSDTDSSLPAGEYLYDN